MEINLNLFKEEMKNLISDMNMTNLKVTLLEMKKLIQIVEYLSDSKYLVQKEILINQSENLNKKEKLLKNEYVFVKKLIGGTIGGIRNSFISESLTREMELESGDLLLIKDKNNIPDSMQKIQDKHIDGVEEDFVLYRYCEIKNDNDFYLYCDESNFHGKQPIKVDDIPFKFVIPNYFVEKFKLSEGDIVDVGYEKSSPHILKIVWRYNLDTYNTPLPSSHYKDGSEKVVNPMYEGIDFNRKTICIIGCEPKRKQYQKAIEYCNGDFIFSNGEEQLERVLSTIDKADVVLILKDFLSHTTVKKSVEHAKNTNKPFSVVDGLGIQTIIFDARKLLAQLESVNA